MLFMKKIIPLLFLIILISCDSNFDFETGIRQEYTMDEEGDPVIENVENVDIHQLGVGGGSCYGYSEPEDAEIAEIEIQNLDGVDQFFAYFNKGTSLVKMEHYLDAGEAFDEAYLIYGGLVDDDSTRPYRITWYQTWPYWAYYFSGRYQDVINLVNDLTFKTIDEPTLEESLYWRGLAHYALGNKAQAKQDLYQSVWLNPNFTAGLIQINNLIFE